MTDKPTVETAHVPRSRFIAGAVIFVTGQLAPLAIPLVTASSLPTSWKTGLTGLLLLGVPELAIVLSVVVLGKAGFDAFRSRIFGWIGRTLLPENVSRPRYYVGLILFLIPILIGWASPYLNDSVPELIRHRLAIAIAGDVGLIVGLCLMGGQAWDKLRSLFVYNARVSFPSATAATATVDSG